MKKKKQKPAKIHLIHPVMMPVRAAHKQEKGRSFPLGRQTWVIGEHVGVERDVEDGNPEEIVNERVDGGLDATGVDGLKRGVAARGVVENLWGIGSEALDVLADTALEAENKENGVQDKSAFEGDGLRFS